ncbi:MAG: hypothetical protein ACYC66_17705 [Chloroflexota bacterium]
MEELVLDDLPKKAARLIAFGLRPKLSPGTNDEYRDLVALYRSSAQFQQLVGRIADGMGLKVVDAHRTGFFLGAGEDCLFTYTLSDLRKERRLSDVIGGYQRGLAGLVIVGIAAYFYPRPSHLAEESHRTGTPHSIDEFIRRACAQLKIEGEPKDEEEEPAWRYYLRQREAGNTPKGYRRQRSTLQMVEAILDVFVDKGLVKKSTEGGVPSYQALERFRHQVALLAGHDLFRALAAARLKEV